MKRILGTVEVGQTSPLYIAGKCWHHFVPDTPSTDAGRAINLTVGKIPLMWRTGAGVSVVQA